MYATQRRVVSIANDGDKPIHDTLSMRPINPPLNLSTTSN